MNFSITGQEKGDLLIQVTVWGGLTVYTFCIAFLISFYHRRNTWKQNLAQIKCYIFFLLPASVVKQTMKFLVTFAITYFFVVYRKKNTFLLYLN